MFLTPSSRARPRKTATGGGAGSIPANGNLTFYIATTGSDSNSGTSPGSPVATLRHAVDLVSQYDWQGLWTPTISIAAGTYNGTTTPSLSGEINGPFKNLINPLNITGSGINCIVADASSQINFQDMAVNIQGINFGFVGNGASLNPLLRAIVSVVGTGLWFTATNAPMYPFFCEGADCAIYLQSTTVTITAPDLGSFFYAYNGNAVLSVFSSTLVLPAAVTVHDDGFYHIEGYGSQLVVGGLTYTNFGGVTGKRLHANNGVFIYTANGLTTDIPGTTEGSIDSTVAFVTGAKFGTYMNFFAGIPTTSQVPTNCCGIWKDTSGGGVYAVANDAGTIKKVALT